MLPVERKLGEALQNRTQVSRRHANAAVKEFAKPLTCLVEAAEASFFGFKEDTSRCRLRIGKGHPQRGGARVRVSRQRDPAPRRHGSGRGKAVEKVLGVPECL